MTMPKFHEMMRPVLVALSSVDSMSISEFRDVAVAEFAMSEDEQQERLGSGQLKILNRIGWAVTDLNKAEYIEHVPGMRGVYRITDSGREFLSRHDAPITRDDLVRESESFRKWKEGSGASTRQRTTAAGDATSSDNTEEQTPREIMDTANRELRDALADELLERIMDQDPDFFEYLVARLLTAMGYGETFEVTQRSNDEGIDGIIKEDRLGFDSIYYQAKRWDPASSVSRPEIQKFAGALTGKSADKGLFITTAKFSSGAREFAEQQHAAKIVLIDGYALARLMIDAGVGVSTVTTYEVKAIDTDFFEE